MHVLSPNTSHRHNNTIKRRYHQKASQQRPAMSFTTRSSFDKGLIAHTNSLMHPRTFPENSQVVRVRVTLRLQNQQCCNCSVDAGPRSTQLLQRQQARGEQARDQKKNDPLKIKLMLKTDTRRRRPPRQRASADATIKRATRGSKHEGNQCATQDKAIPKIKSKPTKQHKTTQNKTKQTKNGPQAID